MKKTELNEACEILGERLKRQRLKQNPTQRDLAARANIQRQGYCRIKELIRQKYVIEITGQTLERIGLLPCIKRCLCQK